MSLRQLRRPIALLAVAALTLLGGSQLAFAANAGSAGGTVGPKEPRYDAKSFNPVIEAENFSSTLERQDTYLTPQYQAELRTIGAQNNAAALAMQAADPQREFSTDLCGNGMDGCAGDVR